MRNNSIKVILLFTLLLFSSKISYSQIDKISYSQDTKNFMNANIQNSRNKFAGITGKITINFEAVKLTPAAKSNIISKIKAIEDVFDCEIMAETFEIIITRKAEEGCTHYAEFKDIIAQESLRILSNSELLFY